MPNELAIPYDVGVGYEDGDGASSSKGVIFNDEYDANFEVMSKLAPYFRYDGNDALDYGSNATSCQIYLRTPEAAVDDVASRRGATVGQECRVLYQSGGNKYLFDVLVQEDGNGYPYIQFDKDDVNLRTPTEATAAIPDFSSAAFIDALDIFTAEVFPPLLNTDLGFQYDAPGTLIGTDIAIDDTASDILGTEFDTVKADVESAITTGTGEIKAGMVKSSSLVKSGDADAVFLDDSPRNLSRGMFDNALYANDILYGLEKTAAPANAYEVETTIVKAGAVSQKFSSNGSAQGIKILLDPLIDQDLLAGKNMTLVAWVYSTNANKLAIGFYDDDAGAQVTTQTYSASDWTKVSVTQTIGASATEVYALIQSVDAVATDHYVDIAGIYIGGTAFDPVAPSVYAEIVNHTLDNLVYNDFIFGDCAAEQTVGTDYPGHAWLNGGATAPFPWNSTILGGTYAIETTDFHSANASISAGMAVGEGLQAYLGLGTISPELMPKYHGKSCTFSCYLLKDGANTEDIDLQITTDGTGGTTTTRSFSVNDYDTWAQIAVTLDTVPTDANYIRIRVMNNGAGAIACFLDSFSITQTGHPVSFTTLTPWKYLPLHFTYAGAQPAAATIMDAQGGLNIAIPIGVNCWLYGMTVYQDTPGTGNDLYYAFTEDWSGLAWTLTNYNGAFSVTLGNLVDYGSAADTDGVCVYISSGSRLGAKVDGDGLAAGSDAFVTLHCLTRGI